MRGDWVDLAAFLMMLAGAIDGLQGLIAIVRNKYYSFTPNQILVVDLTTWGWILLVWGVVVVLLLLNLIGELTFAGAHGSTLWAVTANLLTVIVLYALIVRWEGAADAGVTS